MNKINKQSADLHEDKLKALQSIMPQLFNEDGTIDTKELELLSKNYPSLATGKYEFNWAGKVSAKRNAYKPSRANLKPDKERSIEFDSTENMIIEGDNLEVLKLLQKSYSGKIKCIYIDPPYNTGNDFVYSDDYSEDKKAYWEKSGTTENGVKIDTNTETQGRYHSNWLNMMYPRLVLGRELLKDDGVIFVSIDDHEVYNLKKLMDEIFGEENFVGQLVWQKKYGGGNDSSLIANEHEYILCFANDLSIMADWLEPHTPEYLKRYNEEDEESRYFWDTLERPGLNNPIIVEVKFKNQIYKLKTFRSQTRIDSDLQNGDVRIVEINGEPSFQFKQRLREGKKPRSILRDSKEFELLDMFEKVGSNSSAKKEMREIFGKDVFSNPKPTQLIKHLVKICSDKDSLVLDFFAGSGTTAHAVIDLNKEDDGNRKFILVQIPELTDEKSEAYKAGYKTISDICIERVKRVSEKIKNEDEGKLLKEDKNLDLGFKVFKLAPSFFPENQFTPDPEKSEEENMNAFEEYLGKARSQLMFEFKEEEMLYEIALKDGFKLTFNKEPVEEIKENKVYKISDGEKEALVCLDNTISNSTLKILEGMKDMRFICLERAVDTTKKWNLKSIFGQNLWVA
mgnify:CR=1 FL=1